MFFADKNIKIYMRDSNSILGVSLSLIMIIVNLKCIKFPTIRFANIYL